MRSYWLISLGAVDGLNLVRKRGDPADPGSAAPAPAANGLAKVSSVVDQAACEKAGECGQAAYCDTIAKLCIPCPDDCKGKKNEENCLKKCSKSQTEPVTNGEEPKQWGAGYYEVLTSDARQVIKGDWDPKILKEGEKPPYMKDILIGSGETFEATGEKVVSNQGEIQHFLKLKDGGWLEAFEAYGGAPVVERSTDAGLTTTTTPAPTTESGLEGLFVAQPMKGKHIDAACKDVKCDKGSVCERGLCVYDPKPKDVCRPDKCSKEFQKNKKKVDFDCRSIKDEAECIADKTCLWECDAPAWYAEKYEGCTQNRGLRIDCETNGLTEMSF